MVAEMKYKFNFNRGLKCQSLEDVSFYNSLPLEDRESLKNIADRIFNGSFPNMGENSSIELAIKLSRFMFRANALQLLRNVPLGKMREAIQFMKQELGNVD